MALSTRCPGCESSLRIEERAVGKRVRCPKCRHPFEVTSVTFENVAAPRANETISPATINHSKLSTADSEGRGISDNDLPTGTSFGRFKIISILGQGTYGKVYRAFDPTLDREVALKIPKFGSNRDRMIERFLREAKAAARLRHPSIVGVFESGRIGEDYYIASEFIQGQTMEAAIAVGPIDVLQAAEWCRDLAEGLAYAHENGVVHRDIKPGNILVDGAGRPRITDFGLAKRVDEDATMTTEGSLLGTPAYMSPEQARGQTDKIGPASDQYSLGAVLYELLCGKRPFDGPPHVVIAKAASEDLPPAPRTILAEVPRDLDAICMRALEKEPKRRYFDAQRMADDLDRWLDGTPIRARPISKLERLVRWCRRNPSLSASLAVTVGVLLAAIGGAFTKVVIQLEQAQQQISEAKQIAVEAKKTAEEETVQSQVAQRQLAISQFERGRHLCEGGELTQGLLWLSSSLSNLNPQMSDLDGPIRSYIGSWLPHLHQLRMIIPHESTVNSVSIGPDGSRMVTGTGKENGPGVAQMWDLRTGKKVGPSIDHSAAVSQVAFSPTGNLFASASADKTVRLVDSLTGQVVHSLTHPDVVWSIAFSPDGQRIATGCADEYARIWDVSKGTEEPKRYHHPRPHPQDAYNDRMNRQPHVLRLAFSSDGMKLATSTGDRRLRVWNLASGELQAPPVRAFRSATIPIAFHPKGDRLLTQIELFDPVGPQFRDAATLAPIGPEFNHKIPLNQVCLSSDGKRVLTAGQNEIRVWDAETGESIGQPLRHSSTVTDVCMSADQKTIVTTGADQVVRVWSVAEKPIGGRVFEHTAAAQARFRPDGQSFVTSDPVEADPEIPAPDRLRLWDAQTGMQLAGPFNHGGIMSSVAFTKDGGVYARGNFISAEVCRMETGKPLHDALIHPNRVIAVIFSPDDSQLITGCLDGQIRFWDRTKKAVVEPSLIHGSFIRKLELSSDGSILLSVGQGAVHLWDWMNRRELDSIIELPNGIRTATLLPDGTNVMVVDGGGSIHFWNRKEKRFENRSIPNMSAITSIRFLSNRRSIITSEDEGFTRIWDFQTGLPSFRPYHRKGRAGWLDVNRDESLVVTSGSDPAVRLYELFPPVQGDPDQVRQRLERLLGAALGAHQQVQILDSHAWQSRPALLEERSPPPMLISPFDQSQAVASQQGWADHEGLPVDFTDSLGLQLKLIPPGEFLMGAPDGDPHAEASEKPQHAVVISRPFFMGVHEVTREQFGRFVSESGYVTDAERDQRGGLTIDKAGEAINSKEFSWKSPGFPQEDRHPVVGVSWNDAQAFCRWMSQRDGNVYNVPTIAQWEYACRAGSTTPYSNGTNPDDVVQIGNVRDASWNAIYPKPSNRVTVRDGYANTAPVGSFKPNSFGLFDLHGNVWEWCLGFRTGQYPSGREVDPVGSLTGQMRETRGGAMDCWEKWVRVSARDAGVQDGAAANLGFRVVRVIRERRFRQPDRP